jgi:hypothetical protein
MIRFTSTNTAIAAAMLALCGVVWVCGTAGLSFEIDVPVPSSNTVDSTAQRETGLAVATTEELSETNRAVSNDSDSKNTPSSQQQVEPKLADMNRPSIRVRTGTIRGRIVFDGPPPEHKLLISGLPRVDQAVCSQTEHYDESLLVNPLNNGIKNVFVYVVRRKEFQAATTLRQTPVKVRFIGCRVEPRCVAVQTEQELHFHYDDPVLHIPDMKPSANHSWPWHFPIDGVSRGSFRHTEALPFQYTCAIHPWIRGWILVCDHPFATITDTDGNFAIRGVRYGEHKLRVFHEGGGLLNHSLKVVINSDEVELPDLSFEASRFGY